MYTHREIDLLLARVIDRIECSKDEITFICNNSRRFKMFHQQDCCEVVSVEEIIGDLDDLIGTPIIMAEERSERDNDADESATWTFYEFRTIKGSVTIRWYGASNGYYSEEVTIDEIFDNK